MRTDGEPMTSPMSHARTFTLALVGAALAAALLPAAAAAQSFGKNKIQYQEFDWQIYHSPHFDVYYYSAEEHLLERVVSFAESAYDELSRRFDYQIEESTPLIFYKTHAEFEQNNIILGFIPEAVGAFATDVRFRMVLPVDMPDAELHELILHELTHIFQYHILFGGKVSRSLTSQPPTWLIEGMASYYAEDEDTSDKMFLRDAVVNDMVPPITRAQGGGFFAYRFGHAVYDYMEEKWGDEGVLDFLFEYRNTLGGDVDRALRRAFRVEAEDFDADFRRWLREKYLPELIRTGEPSYFGRRFFSDEGGSAEYFAPAVSPSGDLVAALSTAGGKLDVVLLDSRQRTPMRNLTRGWSTDYQYLTAQFATATRRMGGDLSFSPDGNYIAVFARREQGRSLLLVDVVNGGVRHVIDVPVQQPFSPAWSPDGRSVAFGGNVDGHFDIFLLDVETREVKNLTQDERFDGGPAFSPDGRHLVYSSEVGEFAKLVRLDLSDPTQRMQVTTGDYTDRDPAFSQDGRMALFTSDRNGFDNIYSISLDTGEVRQLTNAVTGCYMPAFLERADAGDTQQMVYAGYWKQDFDIYRGDVEGIGEVVEVITELITPQPTPLGELERYEPDIQVTIDDENKEPYGGWKMFLEDGDIGVGVTSDQLFVSRSLLTFSDYLGDKRVFIGLDTVADYSNIDIIFMDFSERLQWGGRLFDNRTYYLYYDQDYQLDRESAYHQTGIQGLATYPFDFYHRVEGSLGFMVRDYDQPLAEYDSEGNVTRIITPRSDEYPEVAVSFVGDTAVFGPWGAISGRRWRVSGSYAPDLEESGTLTSSVSLEARQYIPITRRIGFALRAFGGASSGNFPDVFYFGGIDTVRGFEFREFVGDRVFYTNLELRFPLIEALFLPFFSLQGVHGRIFLDLGGGYLDYAGEEFDFWDSDGGHLAASDPVRGKIGPVSSYGWGFTANFGGMELNWDFAKIWNLKEDLGDGFETNFWIGSRF
jgi:Tol biopolymer transport system component